MIAAAGALLVHIIAFRAGRSLSRLDFAGSENNSAGGQIRKVVHGLAV